jgi:hypothetical protein
MGEGGGNCAPCIGIPPPPQEGEIPASLHLLLSEETLCGYVEANKLLLSVTSEWRIDWDIIYSILYHNIQYFLLPSRL